MSTKQKRFILPEDEIPKYWYNIQADMKTKPMPPLNPKTKEALKPEDLYPIFAKELCKQELNQTDAWIEIPEAVREMYKMPTRLTQDIQSFWATTKSSRTQPRSRIWKQAKQPRLLLTGISWRSSSKFSFPTNRNRKISNKRKFSVGQAH